MAGHDYTGPLEWRKANSSRGFTPLRRGELGNPAACDPFSHEDTAIGGKAGVVRVYELASLPFGFVGTNLPILVG